MYVKGFRTQAVFDSRTSLQGQMSYSIAYTIAASGGKAVQQWANEGEGGGGGADILSHLEGTEDVDERVPLHQSGVTAH